MNNVIIYTDGACSGNPGPGGFAGIIIQDDTELEVTGGEKQTTNNRMELIAVIESLNQVKSSSNITLYSDSQYIVNAINQGWLKNWIYKNWKKSDGKPVQNVDLWQELIPLLDKHKIKFIWVKGHANNKYNNRCDELACEQRDRYGSM